MADTILIKGGKRANMPTLSSRELVIATDEKALYIGIDGVNTRLCGAGDKAELEDKINSKTAVKQTTLEETTELAGVITAFNSLIEALKAGGLMEK